MESMMSMNPTPKTTDDYYIGIKPLPPRRKEVQESIQNFEDAKTAAARVAGELAGKLDKTGGQASQAVRDAYKETAEQVEKALEELKALVEKIEKEADEFINTLLDAGTYHADRIDTATQNLRTLLAWMGSQRYLISKEILPLPPKVLAELENQPTTPTDRETSL